MRCVPVPFGKELGTADREKWKNQSGFSILLTGLSPKAQRERFRRRRQRVISRQAPGFTADYFAAEARFWLRDRRCRL
jgi:hypothetical protein